MIASREETGTLGVKYLKRFWSKMLARRAGVTAGVPDEPVEDRVLFSGLHLGTLEVIRHVTQAAPTFEEFEAWILELNGGSIPAARIERLNAALDGTLDPGEPPFDGPLSPAELESWDENGYVILHDAVTPQQCAAAAEAIYEYLGVDPADPSTWYQNPAGHSIWVGLLRHPAFFANRESARIRGAHEQILKRKDLWVSIDQGGFNPPERPGWQFPGPHLHWDVSIAQPMPLGVQGILYLTDTEADQGAFTCVPGFNRTLKKWLEELPAGTNPRDLALLNRLPAKPITGRAGDLIIWHHALPHGSSPNRSKRPRVAQYLTMFSSRYEVSEVWV